MIFMAHAHANIEFDGKLEIPTDAEMAKNRGCFDDLTKHGCGEPGEDMKQFRSCLHEVFPNLSSECREMMVKLYKKKD